MNDDRLLALAQIWLSAIYMIDTFAVILSYELGLAHMTAKACFIKGSGIFETAS